MLYRGSGAGGTPLRPPNFADIRGGAWNIASFGLYNFEDDRRFGVVFFCGDFERRLGVGVLFAEKSTKRFIITTHGKNLNAFIIDVFFNSVYRTSTYS